MTITVKRDMSKLMKHDISIRQHSVPTDLAQDRGGEDLGPSPHDLYDAALGACKALTLLWYAKRKAIAVEEVTVTVDRDNAQEGKGVYRLLTQVSITGDVNDAQRQELLRVVAKCPIHRLMTEVETEIETVLI